MFARKLQAIWILIILLVVSAKSSTADLVIADKAKSFTNVTTAITPDSDGGYPIHQVSMVVRGWLVPLDYLRLHWVDWTQQSKWYEDINTDGHDWLTEQFTSPSWAAGYYYEISSFMEVGPHRLYFGGMVG
ncbi:10537_t:CDS:1 [Paraglomus occultum]|uniref:10537_t:CDS:1 n=1 Tax=Paraglomus occultum TaxID=144539 RepID=A0A9N9GS70_9GLOM|nr:10537_t:CDS:1 [Paraglomus occultum]